MSVIVPDRSIVQRLDALAHANRIRFARAQLKRDVKAGRVVVMDVLAAPEDWVSTMKVCELLLAVPKYGQSKVNKTLARCRISPNKTVGGLSDRQRGELVRLLWRPTS